MGEKRTAPATLEAPAKRRLQIWGITVPLQIPLIWRAETKAIQDTPSSTPCLEETDAGDIDNPADPSKRVLEAPRETTTDSNDGLADPVEADVEATNETINREPLSAPVSGAESPALYQEFQRRYRLTMPYAQFVGLCAYLCALLLSGYQISREAVDEFIYTYPHFVAILPTLETEQIENDRPCLISYHFWFRANRPGKSSGEPVISEGGLRAIWREHPHTFVDAETRLNFIAKKRLYSSTPRTTPGTDQ